MTEPKKRRRNGYAFRSDKGKNRQAHIVIWEAAHGPLPAGVDIHHKNEDKKDNRLENLEPILHADHARQHIDDRLARYWATVQPRDFECVVCGATFSAVQPATACSNACKIKKSRDADRERHREWERAYYAKNAERLREYQRERQRKKRATNG